jgi:hypothetical protein
MVKRAYFEDFEIAPLESAEYGGHCEFEWNGMVVLTVVGGRYASGDARGGRN